jgi:hypothetical protein
MAGRTSPTGMHSAHGFGLRLTPLKGGAAGALTLTGIALDDQILAVMGIGRWSGTYYLNTLYDFTAEFSVSAADTIDNTGGTTTTSWRLLAVWADVAD